MSVSGYQRVTIALGVVCFGLLVLCGSLFWRYGWLTFHVACASEQIEGFHAWRTQALQSDAAGAAGCLKSLVGYYPSGTKQETGSRIDRMVERERTRAARDIIAHLRTWTGEDLGASPEAWIQKYAGR